MSKFKRNQVACRFAEAIFTWDSVVERACQVRAYWQAKTLPDAEHWRANLGPNQPVSQLLTMRMHELEYKKRMLRSPVFFTLRKTRSAGRHAIVISFYATWNISVYFTMYYSFRIKLRKCVYHLRFSKNKFNIFYLFQWLLLHLPLNNIT